MTWGDKLKWFGSTYKSLSLKIRTTIHGVTKVNEETEIYIKAGVYTLTPELR
jgi:hypothetical protein